MYFEYEDAQQEASEQSKVWWSHAVVRRDLWQDLAAVGSLCTGGDPAATPPSHRALLTVVASIAVAWKKLRLHMLESCMDGDKTETDDEVKYLAGVDAIIHSLVIDPFVRAVGGASSMASFFNVKTASQKLDPLRVQALLVSCCVSIFSACVQGKDAQEQKQLEGLLHVAISRVAMACFLKLGDDPTTAEKDQGNNLPSRFLFLKAFSSIIFGDAEPASTRMHMLCTVFPTLVKCVGEALLSDATAAARDLFSICKGHLRQHAGENEEVVQGRDVTDAVKLCERIGTQLCVQQLSPLFSLFVPPTTGLTTTTTKTPPVISNLHKEFMDLVHKLLLPALLLTLQLYERQQHMTEPSLCHGNDDSNNAAEAQQRREKKAVCSAIEHLISVPVVPNNESVSGSCNSSSLSGAVEALDHVFLAAMLHDGTVSPSTRTLKQKLLTQRLPTKLSVSSLEALRSKMFASVHHKGPLEASSSALLESLASLIAPGNGRSTGGSSSSTSSVVLAMYAWLDASSRVSPPQFKNSDATSMDYESSLSVDDSKFDSLKFDIRKHEANNDDAGATGSRVIISGLQEPIKLFFPRLWGAYAALEIALQRMIDGGSTGVQASTALLPASSSSSSGSCVSRHLWRRKALLAATEAAFDLLSQESGNAACVDHFSFLSLVEKMSRDGVLVVWGQPEQPRPISSMFPFTCTIAKKCFESSSSSPVSIVTAPQPLTVLHRRIVHDGAVNLFGFFLPIFRAIGCDYTVFKSETDALRGCGPQFLRSSFGVFASAKFRTAMHYLHLNAIACVREKQKAPALAQNDHAMCTLEDVLFYSSENRQMFLEIVAEAAILTSLKCLKLEPASQRVAAVDMDCAAALFFSVLRFASRKKDLTSTPFGRRETPLTLDIRHAFVKELQERVSTTLIPSSYCHTDRRKIVREFLAPFFHMVQFSTAEVENLKDEEPPTGVGLAADAVSSPSPPEQEASVKEVNQQLQESSPKACEEEVLSAPTSTVVSGDEVLSAALPVAASAESEEISNSSTAALATEVVTTPLSSSSATEVPAISTPPPATVHPSSTPQTTQGPPLRSWWHEWFWQTDISEAVSTAESIQAFFKSDMIRLLNVPHEVVIQCRVMQRDMTDQVKSTLRETEAAHLDALRKTLDETMKNASSPANAIAALRTTMMQMVQEMALRATLSVPDALTSFAILCQWLRHLYDLKHAKTITLPEMVVSDTLRRLQQCCTHHLSYGTRVSATGLTSFWSRYLLQILLQWKKALSASSSSATGNGASGSSSVATDAAVTALSGIIAPVEKGMELLRDGIMETSNAFERLLAEGTWLGDFAASHIKCECIGVLGLVEKSYDRVKNAEKKRLEAFSTSSREQQESSSTLPDSLKAISAYSWDTDTSGGHSSDPVRDVKHLFVAPSSSSKDADRHRRDKDRKKRSRSRSKDDRRKGRRREGDETEKDDGVALKKANVQTAVVANAAGLNNQNNNNQNNGGQTSSSSRGHASSSRHRQRSAENDRGRRGGDRGQRSRR